MRKAEIITDIRAFNALEFNFLEVEILKILGKVMESQNQFSTLNGRQFFPETFIDKTFPGVDPAARDIVPFKANKKLIADDFLDQLLEKYILENKVPEHTASTYREALRAEKLNEESLFRIMPVEGDDGYCKVKVPFAASADFSSPSRFQISHGKSKLITERSSGNHFLFVSKATLQEIFSSLKAHIDSQAASFSTTASVNDLRPRVVEKKKELHVEKHPYADIYEGNKGVAYQGRGLRGLLYSLGASLFEAKPKNNLEKVVRLLRNYQNQMKSLTHTHTDEVSDLISGLESLSSSPAYKGMSEAERDLLIVGRLQTLFERWSGEGQTGSAMRRVVFAMDKIIPGVAARLVMPSGSVGVASAAIGVSLRAPVDTATREPISTFGPQEEAGSNPFFGSVL